MVLSPGRALPLPLLLIVSNALLLARVSEAAMGAVGFPILGVLLGGFTGASIGGSTGWNPIYP